MKIIKLLDKLCRCVYLVELFNIISFGTLINLIIVFSPINVYPMMNPAAVYCDALGYTYTITRTEFGEKGLCELPNGETVDAWDFLQGKVAPEWSYCAKQGLSYRHYDESDDSAPCKDCLVCISEDGKEEEVTTYMGLKFVAGECGDGTCGMPENYSTCPRDCPSGGIDGYCDKVRDGRVDPDCAEGEDPDSILPGDLDHDGDVDRSDVNIVMSHRNKSAEECPECDLDGDGKITVLDARKVILMCTCPRCVCSN